MEELPPAEAVGGFLRTAAGSCYRIESVRELPSGRWKLETTRWPPEEVPDDALVIEWRWASRSRRG